MAQGLLHSLWLWLEQSNEHVRKDGAAGWGTARGRKADDTVGCKINSKTKVLRKAATARTRKPNFPQDALAAVALWLSTSWTENPSTSFIPFASSSVYFTPASFLLCCGAVAITVISFYVLFSPVLLLAFCILHNSMKMFAIKISKKKSFC